MRNGTKILFTVFFFLNKKIQMSTVIIYQKSKNQVDFLSLTKKTGFSYVFSESLVLER